MKLRLKCVVELNDFKKDDYVTAFHIDKEGDYNIYDSKGVLHYLKYDDAKKHFRVKPNENKL